MSTREERARHIARIALPPPSDPRRAKILKRLAEREDDVSRDANKTIIEVSHLRRMIQHHNGCDSAIASTLREFCLEYSGRAAQHGLHAFPLSYNVLEAFFDYIPIQNTFEILVEKNHLCSLAEFLDYHTVSGESAEKHDLPEDTVLNFSFVDDPRFSLSDDNGEYVISGISIVKRSGETNVLLLGGRRVSADEPKIGITSASDLSVHPDKADLKAHPSHTNEVVRLIGAPEFQRFLFTAVFSGSPLRRDLNTLLIDYGDSYLVFTDDINSLTNDGMSIDDKTIEDQVRTVNNHRALIELSQVAIGMPAYFEKNERDVEDHISHTKLKEIWPKIHKNRLIESLPEELKVFSRPVSTLFSESPLAAGELKTPIVHTETAGYWKKLDSTTYGISKHGNPELGRTWVSTETTWATLPTTSAIQLTPPPFPEGPSPGYIYVMRSSSHVENLFKIGRTSRMVEQRRAELSSATGVPSTFDVVYSFPTGNSVGVEARIHAELKEYRYKKNREFFHLDLQRITTAINRVLQQMREEPVAPAEEPNKRS